MNVSSELRRSAPFTEPPRPPLILRARLLLETAPLLFYKDHHKRTRKLNRRELRVSSPTRRNISVEELKQLEDTDGVKLDRTNITLFIVLQGFILYETLKHSSGYN